MLITDSTNIIHICKKEREYFSDIIKDLHYEIKGIFNSELLFLCSLSKFLNVRNIIESGRARGYSTEVLSRFFKDDPLVRIYSIEYLKYSKDSIIALKKLYKYGNLRFFFGNSFSILPHFTHFGSNVVLIDGPKGKHAVQLASLLLRNPLVKAVFIHDLHKDTEIRSIVEKNYPIVFSTDNLKFVKIFNGLDKPCWDVYSDRGPFRRGEVKMKSYGPTLTMILNNEKGIDNEKRIRDLLDLEPICITKNPVKIALRRMKCSVPKKSEVPLFLRYYKELIRYKLFSRINFSENKKADK